MNTLNTQAGLNGRNLSVSHAVGDGYDADQEPEVVAILNQIKSLQRELDKIKNEDIPYQEITRSEQIKADEQKIISLNTFANGNWNNAVIDAEFAKYINPAKADQKLQIANLKARAAKIENELLPNLQSDYQKAKKAALDAQDQILAREIEKLKAKALTDPVAAQNLAEMEKQKQANEIEKQKLTSSASNKKMWIWVGAIVAIVVVIATVWIVLKRNKAIG